MSTMVVPSSVPVAEPPSATSILQTPNMFAASSGPTAEVPSRSYSATAPTDLHRPSVQRQQHQHQHQQQKHQHQHQHQILQQQIEDMPWWQYYYQLYQYQPPAGRKPTVFGPYLLLHTLGEGEFGKVKLGIHIESGQEVAIKLIKKDHIDSTSRISKVEREISVLRTVCHPYIVKLYDVIETDKYIGIILQCASGGELFEYILAHRYLRERDACRLFAQLISGVNYLHQKHIVHRDLKLENLLLDRDRNIIITDFGFANQFSSAQDDLMATSCGSPCYAAPELVVSEGMYVGSAVDIWSCGVILYAMLCGYLPFDDDPANPEGDNINLLYKYILNTQLAFPDYVSNDARDLLQKMLVPDPVKRCTIKTIIEHNWLRPHRDLFTRTIGDLELEAMESNKLILLAPPTKTMTVQRTGTLSDDPYGTTTATAPKSTVATPAAISASCSENDDVDEDGAMMVPEQHLMEIDSEEQTQIVPESPEKLPKEETCQQRQAEECNVKGTMTATTNINTVPDISALELPASMHDENTEPCPILSPDSSILQAKFLSSIQKHNSSAPYTTSPVPILTALTMSQSTPPQQQKQEKTSNHHSATEALPAAITAAVAVADIATAKSAATRRRAPSTVIPKATKSHEPRRKALSLLVNSVADHLQHQNHHLSSDRQHAGGKKALPFTRKHGNRGRAQSVLNTGSNDHHYHNQNRYSGFKRVIGGGKMDTINSSDHSLRSSIHVMPSMSERATILTEKDKHKSAGKKLMEWFKKKPLSTRDRQHHGDLLMPDRPLSSMQIRAMPIGKSYAVDFNDVKLRTHHGAVDQDALTSGSPIDVLVEVKQVLLSMGIEVKKDGEYKLKCIRQRRKQPPSPPQQQKRQQQQQRQRPNSSGQESSGSSSTANSRTDKKRRMSTSTPFKKFLRRSTVSETTGPGGTVFATTTSPELHGKTVYGDPVVDPGEEVRFSVELCKIKNLPGLYIVDIRRMRGNVWAYKFLYHTLLDTLNLSGKGGYIKTPQQQQAPATDQQQASSTNTTSSCSTSSLSNRRNPANRHSSASSGGSSSVLEDVQEEE